MRAVLLLPLIAAAGSILSGCVHPPSRESQTSPPGETVLSKGALESAKHKVDFVAHVKPILEAKCVMCHNRKTLPGRMSLENHNLAFRTGATGAFIEPGAPEKSLLIANIRAAHAHVNAMPPVGERITTDELAVLKKWIRDGAPWPEGRAGRLNPDWTPKE